MSEILATDTPITRTYIEEMDPDTLIEYVATLQQRRLKSHNVYLEGQRAAREKAADKQAGALSKELDKFVKLEATVQRALDKLHASAIQIQSYRIAMGDLG